MNFSVGDRQGESKAELYFSVRTEDGNVPVVHQVVRTSAKLRDVA